MFVDGRILAICPFKWGVRVPCFNKRYLLKDFPLVLVVLYLLVYLSFTLLRQMLHVGVV